MTKRTIRSLIAILFVISGATGLIYQIVWFKYLSLFLGNTTYAQTVVVATFMAGLALGAWLFGRMADRRKNPVQLYGILEMGIALYCLAFPFIFELQKSLFVHTVSIFHLETGSASLLLLKLAISVLTIALPAALMGGTLPVLVKGISEGNRNTGRTVSLLYALNSFGAAAGTIAAGFFLIRTFGLSVTIVAASVLNILLALSALWLSSKDPGITDTMETSVQSSYSPTRSQVIVALVVAGLSGAASMIYEMTWVRMLVLVIGSSTYSFSLMLVAFISGIAIGSLIVQWKFFSLKDPVVALAWCQIGIAIFIVDTLPLYGGIPYLFWKIGSLFPHTDAMYPLFVLTQYGLLFIVMVFPTILLGMSLPLAAAIVTSGSRTKGFDTGKVFAVNTFGAVTGTVLAGFFLISFLGLQHTVEVAIGISAVCGTALWLVASIEGQKKFNAIIVLIVCIGAYSMLGSDWTRLMTYSGVPRALSSNAKVPDTFEEFSKRSYYEKELFYKESAGANVAVARGVVLGTRQNILLINGKPDASSFSDLPTQVMLGQIPALLHGAPKSVLVVGYGSGVTAGSVLTHDVQHLDVVEISPEVIEASIFFNDVNNEPMKDPRTRIIIEDALVHLQVTQQRYDVIISEPSNPWIAGIGDLYSKEFFDQCRMRLNPNGMMAQWFHLYEMDDASLRLVLRTFRSVFPYVTVWHPVDDDIIIIGSQIPQQPDLSGMERTFSGSKVARDFERVLISNLTVMLSLQSMGTEQARQFAGSGPLNSEDHPILEYNAPKTFFTGANASEFKNFDARLSRIPVRLLLSEHHGVSDLPDNIKMMLAFYHADPIRGNRLYSYRLLSELKKKYPLDQDINGALAAVALSLGDLKRSTKIFSDITD